MKPATVSILSIAMTFALTASPLVAQTTQPPADVAAAPDPAPEAADDDKSPSNPGSTTVELHLVDGSIITGKLGVNAIDVSTKFGKLTVPITNLQAFRPGLDSLSSLREKIEQLVEQLGAVETPVRDKAQRELTQMGMSVLGELKRYEKDPDPERQLRIKKIIDEVEQMAEEDSFDEEGDEGGDDPMIRLDTVVTSDFTIVGKIENKSFNVESKYGKLTIRLGDVREVRRDGVGGDSELRKVVTIQGQHVAQRSFKASGLRVNKGDRVSIRADGTLTLTPWGSNAMSTPDGASNYGWYINGKIPMGCLVARIGNNGTIFKVGSSHDFTATSSGMLMFAFGMHQSYINNVFPGQYRIRVKVERADQ